MKVLITGGAGFIGSTLADRLLFEGNKILIIDNFTTGRRDNISKNKNLTLVEGSITNKKLVKSAFSDFKPDFVVHAAASYKDPNNWEEDTMTNIIGTINVVRASIDQKVKRLIYFQTSLCYGLTPLEQPITLKHPLFSGAYSGGSSYAISKTGGELYIELSGLDFISFRLANVFGPRNLSGPLPTFYHRISNNLPCLIMDTRRDFLYVGDLINVVMKALQGKGKSGYYHVSSGRDSSIKKLFNEALRALKIKTPIDVRVQERSREDVATILLDPKKTNRDFAWKTKTPLRKGVVEAIKWYKIHGVTQTFTHLRIKK